MSSKLFIFFLVLGILALSVQAGGKKEKNDSSESKEKSSESKSDNSNSRESKSEESGSNSKSDESNSQEDCEEPPVKPPKPPQKCGHNEEWTNCGTACPLTCGKPKPDICILKCVVGCQCKKGLLRNKLGQCVEACDC